VFPQESVGNYLSISSCLFSRKYIFSTCHPIHEEFDEKIDHIGGHILFCLINRNNDDNL
jgi:hypothetical protein